jgi:hypothetical protein
LDGIFMIYEICTYSLDLLAIIASPAGQTCATHIVVIY